MNLQQWIAIIAGIVKATLDFLRIVAWPLFLGFVVWYFRDEIKKSFGRVTRVGPTGAEFARYRNNPLWTYSLCHLGALRGKHSLHKSNVKFRATFSNRLYEAH